MQACEKCNFYENQNKVSGSCRVNPPIVLQSDNKAVWPQGRGCGDAEPVREHCACERLNAKMNKLHVKSLISLVFIIYQLL